ncbi:hypothetical protein F4677DRAFT_464786 [Hypoxylon crocopeplum]|nr:hypothetical protein F4677DRAFT_464786 [Hypoxylon crocopeplum]
MQHNAPDPTAIPHLNRNVLFRLIHLLRLPVNSFVDTVPPGNFLRNRSILYNLCLTSRYLYEHATPLLYETVVFFLDDKEPSKTLAKTYGDMRHLLLLIRTLVLNPNRSPMIKNVVCPSNLAADISWPWLQPGDVFAQRLLGVMLRLCPNVELLLLRQPPDDWYQYLFGILTRGTGNNSVRVVFAQLSTLCLQQLDNDDLDEIVLDVPLRLHWTQNIVRLHIWRDRGFYFFDPNFSWAQQLLELKFVGCVEATAMYRICREAVRLEILSLVISGSGNRFLYPPPAERDLNHALALRAGTLKELEFRTCKFDWYRDQIGISERLKCLPLLERLERLTVEIPIISKMSRTNPGSLTFVGLPRNIISLEIVEGWPAQNRALIEKLLIEFASVDSDHLLSLRRIRYVFNTPNPTLIDLDRIGSSFDPTRLRFSYEEDNIEERYHLNQD